MVLLRLSSTFGFSSTLFLAMNSFGSPYVFIILSVTRVNPLTVWKPKRYFNIINTCDVCIVIMIIILLWRFRRLHRSSCFRSRFPCVLRDLTFRIAVLVFMHWSHFMRIEISEREKIKGSFEDKIQWITYRYMCLLILICYLHGTWQKSRRHGVMCRHIIHDGYRNTDKYVTSTKQHFLS